MAGGPINGVPWSAVAGLLPGAATIISAARHGTNPNDPKSYTGIIIPTVLQMAADVLRYWTNITCLYDRYWVPDPNKVTLPICIFHVKKIDTVYQVESSNKRVLVYEQKVERNESAADLAQNMRNTSMRAIIDNTVKQPTTYQMDVTVPFQPVGRYFTDGIKTISDMIMGFSGLGEDTKFSDVRENALAPVFAFLKTAGAAAELVGRLPSMDGVSYINMNSLEAMSESCRTLCMKMWTGFSYKYVQITNMTYNKQPLEDDVFRASLSLKEIPVLTLSPPKPPRNPNVTDRRWAAAAIGVSQSALVSPLVGMTGVRKAAGGGESAEGMIKGALGG